MPLRTRVGFALSLLEADALAEVGFYTQPSNPAGKSYREADTELLSYCKNSPTLWHVGDCDGQLNYSQISCTFTSYLWEDFPLQWVHTWLGSCWEVQVNIAWNVMFSLVKSCLYFTYTISEFLEYILFHYVHCGKWINTNRNGVLESWFYWVCFNRIPPNLQYQLNVTGYFCPLTSQIECY